MTYDGYGNITRMTKPENYNHQRMFYAYTYDDRYHSLVTSVKDAYGYSSSTAYDGLWNAPSVTTDLNGQKMEYTYDALGRQQTIRAPYEIESGQPFTIRFEYFPAERKAHTIHYSKEGNIDTYTFADSLMRAVQTKQTGVVWSGGSNQKVSIVSGRAVIDAFGRNIAAYYPMTESYGNIGTYNHATGDLQAKTEYDAHDRTMSVTLADGSVTRTAYSIGSHDGEPMLQTTVTDALGRHAESYTDAKGRNRETVQHARGEDITVKYSYDPVGQVMTVQHPNGRETKYAYDLLGRKLMVNHPDAGETDMTYDAAGNLLTKLTAELRKSISDKGYISYTYDFERLHEVLYPENLFNRVTYTYGKAGDKYNRAGRLALVEDASGGEAYYYGRQGEVTKTVRTVMASVADIRTYVYGATYDSWNRVQTMTYPDGEVVTYHYNAAGQVESLTSNKQGRQSVIVDRIGYDKEGHTVYTKLGNGTETTNTYDKQRERLQAMNLTADGQTVMENRYRYDAVDNILGITNAADPTSLTRLNKAKLGGRSHYGANGTGRFADCILWIQEFDLGNVDNTVQRDYMGDNYGSFNIFVSDNQLYVELRLDVTNRSEDALSETIAHELALHGSYISKCVEAYRENKDNPIKASEIISRMMSQDPHGNKDHADLKDNNQSNIGVVNYLNTMKEMGLKPQKQVKE